ncbi:putative RDD family membrane protein YckC [Kribbella steppae]|uniref:Putative RDD family membrane protein YckC n=1 Tax=Kribbella steppae TaxID=2512223 RepID=A0A4R2H4C9_9ACTN|nr:RDD family protein [Kribbella steppae]TCO20432.1 putative RDD family membrane protein YckC [Kribbella steppae]
MSADEHISIVPREARPYQGRYAGVVTRLAAGAVDGIVVAVALLAGYVGVNGFLFLLDPRGFQFTEASLLLSGAAWMLVLIVYLTVAWSTTGRSYGCRVMGLRVVSRRGRRVRPLVALARAVFCAVFPIGLLLCAGGRRHSSLQDLVLRTSVIYDWRPGQPR